MKNAFGNKREEQTLSHSNSKTVKGSRSLASASLLHWRWEAAALEAQDTLRDLLKIKQDKYINNILKTLYFYIKSKIYIPLKQSGNFIELTALILDWKQTNYLFLWSQALVIAMKGRPAGAQHTEEMYHWPSWWKVVSTDTTSPPSPCLPSPHSASLPQPTTQPSDCYSSSDLISFERQDNTKEKLSKLNPLFSVFYFESVDSLSAA